MYNIFKLHFNHDRLECDRGMGCGLGRAPVNMCLVHPLQRRRMTSIGLCFPASQNARRKAFRMDVRLLSDIYHCFRKEALCHYKQERSRFDVSQLFRGDA